MTNLPKLRTKYGEGVGIELFIQFPDLSNNEKTFLDADEASGQTALSANGTNFAVGQYIVIGNPGSEKTEIVKLHAVTTPNSTTITTAAATTYAHSRGEKITFIPYNQIIVERSTDAGASYTPLTAVDIRADATETYIQRPSDSSTDYYRFRFYNSADATYSAYSDAVVASGYADNTVHAVISKALTDLGEELGGKLTYSFLLSNLNEARRELDQDPRVKRFSFRTKFNTDIGNIIPGRYSVDAPSDLRDRNTHENILSLRIGRNNEKLTYQDRIRFNQNYENVAHSTLNGQITSASTSITLTSSGDFDESGSIYVAAEDVAGTNDIVAYTANNESTNVLSGVTGVALTHATGRDVWQNVNFGEPGCYTIDNGVIYFDVPFEDELAGENIYADYYQSLQAVNSPADTLDEPSYDLYSYFLKAKIKYLKANGNMSLQEDSDFKEWLKGKELIINQEISGQYGYFIPVASNDYYDEE